MALATFFLILITAYDSVPYCFGRSFDFEGQERHNCAKSSALFVASPVAIRQTIENIGPFEPFDG